MAHRDGLERAFLGNVSSALLVGIVLAACPPPDDDDGSISTSPIPGVDAFEGHAWKATDIWVEEDDAKGYVDLEIHIFKMKDDVWCGWVKAHLHEFQVYVQGWHALDSTTEATVGWGRFVPDPDFDDRMLFYGWIPPLNDGNGPPKDPDAMPGEAMPYSEEDPYDFVGYFNMEPEPDTTLLHQLDAVNEVYHVPLVDEDVDVDLPPVDMPETELVDLDQSEWCGTWID